MEKIDTVSWLAGICRALPQCICMLPQHTGKHQYHHQYHCQTWLPLCMWPQTVVQMAACHLGAPDDSAGGGHLLLPFVLIQGPPGTGKTHTVKVGCRDVRGGVSGKSQWKACGARGRKTGNLLGKAA